MNRLWLRENKKIDDQNVLAVDNSFLALCFLINLLQETCRSALKDPYDVSNLSESSARKIFGIKNNNFSASRGQNDLRWVVILFLIK